MATIHASLTRPLLIGGSNAIPTALLYTGIAILLLTYPVTFTSLGICIFLALAGQATFIALAYFDPDWWPILISHLQQQDIYLASGRGRDTRMLFKTFSTDPDFYPDKIPYDTMPTPGVMVNKNLSLTAAYAYWGPDLEVATAEELQGLTRHINNAIKQLGSGWSMHVDLTRYESRGYPEEGAFPDATSRAIDQERREQYNKEGTHYESLTCFSITYQPPHHTTRRLKALFSDRQDRTTGMDEALAFFEHGVSALVDMLGTRLRITRLEGSDLLTFLHRCVTGLPEQVAVPDPATYLDLRIGSQDFQSGFHPKVGQLHVRTIAVTEFPQESRPAILNFLGTLPCQYRWSTRAIFLDSYEARNIIESARGTHDANLYGLVDKLGIAFFNAPPQFENLEAKTLANDANGAIAELDSGEVGFCYYTSVIVLYHDDEKAIGRLATNVVTELKNNQFPSRIEEWNAEEAFLGSIPGNTWSNVRKPPVSTQNLADFIPSTTIWPGPDTISNPYFPENSPPVMFAATTGQTPFRYSPYVGDIGHKLVIGATGGGKTTHNNFEVTQFLRYPGAQVFALDRMHGMELMTVACGGLHLDLGNNEGLAFCPLAHIEQEGEQIRAAEWIESCVLLQGGEVGIPERKAIFRALELMATERIRTMTAFVATIQDRTISEALTAYTLERPWGWLFDAEEDLTLDSHIVTFDIGKLMDAGDKYLIPALLNIFHLIERRLNTGRPTYIPIDEGWMVFLRAYFEEKFLQWLRTFRAKNAAVCLITQSLADLNQSKYRDQILQQCPTKIFLPDGEAHAASVRGLYEAAGLNEQAIDLLTVLPPKRWYLFTSRSAEGGHVGTRPYQLRLGPTALAICGKGGDENRRKWKALQAVDAECWVAQWMAHCGAKDGAKQWREYKQQEILEQEVEL